MTFTCTVLAYNAFQVSVRDEVRMNGAVALKYLIELDYLYRTEAHSLHSDIYQLSISHFAG